MTRMVSGRTLGGERSAGRKRGGNKGPGALDEQSSHKHITLPG